jgi:hypothetical protein
MSGPTRGRRGDRLDAWPPAETARRLTGVALLVVALAAVTLPAVAHGYYHVHADPQVSADGSVVVERAFVSADGWVVLHADDGGSPGRPLGHAALGPADGTQTDFRLPVDGDVWDDWEGARTVHVALHRDEGTERFVPGEDPVLSSFGQPATDRFTLQRGPAAAVSAESFTLLDVENGSATVRTVAMPTGGHLVAHAVEGADATRAGNVTLPSAVGATTLGAGTHRDVPVRLNGSFARQQTSQFDLAFTLYRDDGDGTFTGEERPVRAGTERVATVVSFDRPARAATESDGGGTPTAAGGTGATSATATPAAGEDSSLVVTATGTTARATSDPTATRGVDAGSPPAGDGSGFGVAAGVLGVVLASAVAARRGRQ